MNLVSAGAVYDRERLCVNRESTPHVVDRMRSPPEPLENVPRGDKGCGDTRPLQDDGQIAGGGRLFQARHRRDSLGLRSGGKESCQDLYLLHSG